MKLFLRLLGVGTLGLLLTKSILDVRSILKEEKFQKETSKVTEE